MTDRRPIGIRQLGFANSDQRDWGAKSRVFGARMTEAQGEREATACVRVPVNNKFAVTRYKYQGSIGYISLQSTYVDTRRYIYITSTLHVPYKTESASENKSRMTKITETFKSIREQVRDGARSPLHVSLVPTYVHCVSHTPFLLRI